MRRKIKKHSGQLVSKVRVYWVPPEKITKRAMSFDKLGRDGRGATKVNTIHVGLRH